MANLGIGGDIFNLWLDVDSSDQFTIPLITGNNTGFCCFQARDVANSTSGIYIRGII